MPWSTRAVALEDLLAAADFDRRPTRAPDHAGECEALAALTDALAQSPRAAMRQVLCTALRLCRAQSAGIGTVIERADDAPQSRAELPRPSGSVQVRALVVAGLAREPEVEHLPDMCGFSEAVLRRGSPLFVHRPERFFASALPAWASVREALVVPFHAQERLVGLMWVLLHDAKRHFEPEDARLLGELAGFAGAAVRLHEGPKAWSRHEKWYFDAALQHRKPKPHSLDGLTEI